MNNGYQDLYKNIRSEVSRGERLLWSGRPTLEKISDGEHVYEIIKNKIWDTRRD